MKILPNLHFDNFKKSILNYKNNSIKQSTLDEYILKLYILSKNLFKTSKPSIHFFKDFESIKDYLESNYNSDSSKKNFITAILVLIKSFNLSPVIIHKYSSYHKDLSCKINDSYNTNKQSVKEQSNWITRQDIMDKIDSLRSSIPSFKQNYRVLVDIIQQHLVLNLYTQLPPIRNDYANVKVIYEDNLNDMNLNNKLYNYIDLTNNLLLLTNYKTDKCYGIKQIKLPETLISIISEWMYIRKKLIDKINKNDTFYSPFLLLNIMSFSPMTKNGLTKYINKIFKPKKISTTLFRKIYLSEKYPVVHTNNEMVKDSYIMGHSVKTQQSIYRKKIEN